MGVKDKAVSAYETYLFQGLLFCYDVEQICIEKNMQSKINYRYRIGGVW